MAGTVFLWAAITADILMITVISGVKSKDCTTSCCFKQQTIVGQSYSIYSPGYPSYYAKVRSHCQWIAKSPPNTTTILNCEDIDIPKSEKCRRDQMTIYAADVEMQSICGRGTTQFESNTTELTVELHTSGNNRGSRFMCTLLVRSNTVATVTDPFAPQSLQKSCECGWKKVTKIIGGVETGVNEYPAMAGIVALKNRELHCGGTIISHHIIVTAAHCVVDKKAEEIAILVGDHDYTTGSDTEAAKLYQVKDITVMPHYNPFTYDNDIALVKTIKKIDFNVNVGPVCLPFRHSWRQFAGSLVTVLGWGNLDFAGPTSNTLQQVTLPVITNTQCNSEEYRSQNVTCNQLCTHAMDKDSCQHDSGGPVLFQDDDAVDRPLFLVGIVSTGRHCATANPGLHTRVTSYLGWLMSETKEEFCIK